MGSNHFETTPDNSDVSFFSRLVFENEGRKAELSKEFLDWSNQLDSTVRSRVARRIRQMLRGSLGNHKYLDNILVLYFSHELCVYCKKGGTDDYLILCGGHYSRQTQDLKKAHRITVEGEK